MRFNFLAAGLLSLGSLSGAALAAEVKETVEIKAGPDQVWTAIGDFCGIAQWHPVLAGCEMAETDGMRVRTLTTKDGAKLIEPLENWDDAGRSYTYRIQESPLPVQNYVSTIKVTSEGETSTVEWSGSFEPKGASEDEAKGVISGIYKAGLEALQKKF